jgi:hypothetical protein
VLAEPKYHLLEIGRPQIKAAIGDDGKPMNALKLNEDYELTQAVQSSNAGCYQFFYETRAKLRRSDANVKAIKEVHGIVVIKAAIPGNKVLIPKNFLELKGTIVQIGNIDLAISEACQDEDGSTKLNIRVYKGDLLAYWPNRIQLEDVKGNRYELKKTTLDSLDGRFQTTMFFEFAKPEIASVGPPVKLIVEDWTIVRHSIPFVFRDVPLP